MVYTRYFSGRRLEMNNNKNQLETLLFKQTYILIITNKDHNKLLQNRHNNYSLECPSRHSNDASLMLAYRLQC